MFSRVRGESGGLKNELADERARSIVVQAQEDKAKTLMGRTQREMDHAKDQLVQQQKQAEEPRPAITPPLNLVGSGP